jgi:ankyrin repeat protein
MFAQADVNVQDRHGGTPMEDALRHKHESSATLLWKHGAQRMFKHAAEHLCSAASSPEGAAELTYIVQFSADVNVANVDKRTALHLAAAQGQITNLRLLLKNNAKVNMRDNRGATALQDALLAGDDTCCELLLSHGADLGTFDDALYMCTAAATDDLPQLKRLLQHRCKVNVTDHDSRTPLHLAASNGRVATVHFLLEQEGILVNAADQFGNTPFDDAEREKAKYGPTVRSLLLAHGGVPGKHVRHQSSSLVNNFEEDKADANAQVIASRNDMMSTVHGICRWVHRERVAAHKIRRLVEEMVALEASDGAVITEHHPEF